MISEQAKYLSSRLSEVAFKEFLNYIRDLVRMKSLNNSFIQHFQLSECHFED